MRNDQKNIIVDKTFKFSLEVVKYVDLLERNGKKVVANQLLKSGTSIGANVREAQNSESKADFIHKMKIAAKESDETAYWIELCDQSDIYPSPERELTDQIEAIIKILSKIIATSKNKIKS